jgi:glycosyltransferase involved in cell wall biosynthesis
MSLLPAALPLAPAGEAAKGTGPRLLFVVRGAENYGTETKMFGLLESLTGRGAAVGLYALGDGHFAELARSIPALPVVIGPPAPPRFEVASTSRVHAYLRTAWASVPFMGDLAAFLRRHSYDAIVFCEHGLVLQIGAVARRTGIPAFWVMANGITGHYPLDLNRRLYALTFRHLRVVPVANSEYTRMTLGRGVRYASKIDLGINPSRVVIPAAPVLPGSRSERVQLLVMARLVEGKGQMVLLKALLSNPAFSAIDLTLCGGPLGTPYADSLAREAVTHDARDRVHLVGPVTDVARYYGMADVVVSARLDPEPFGLSIVEAMMMGKPVLAHASGGPSETVIDGVTGWHITAPTVEAFASGLSRMLADRAKWPQIGQAGRARAQARYTHHTMTDQLLAAIAPRLGRS